MFQNMLKRSWLSVRRKISRSIIIGLILFAMGNLVLSSIVIKSAVNESTEYAKETLGSTVSLQANMANLREDFQKQKEESSQNDKMEKPTFKRPSVSKEIADKIAESEFVKDYTYAIQTSANSNKLEKVESTSSSDMPFDRMPGKMDKSESGDFTVQGINAYAYIQQVENKSMTIEKGTYFNEDDLNKVILSVDLAEQNDLSVNDKITLKNIYTNKEITLQVIGIYDTSEERADANTIYMNVDTAAKFLSKDDYNSGNYSVENVKYTATSGEVVQNLVAWINENFPSLKDANIEAKEDTSAYDRMAGPIENVGSFATVVFWIVIVASIVIVTLIVTINVKDRHYEMGVLLSLGARKFNIIGQIIIELFIIGTAAFGLSIITSNTLAKNLSQNILQSQIESAKNESENNFGRPTGRQIGDRQTSMPNIKDENSSVETQNKNHGEDTNTITEINVKASIIDYLILFGLGYLVIIIASLIPSLNVLRYQPKSILQGKD